MDLLIPDNWLREFIKTDATNNEMAKYLSLCGPSVEKITKTKLGDVYSVEVTTNRIDSTSVYGIAREASVILPRFDKKAKLVTLETKSNYQFVEKVNYLNVVVDYHLCPRFTAVLIKNVKIGESPLVIKERLTASGVRPINNVVDISNYIMLEMGQPMHTFDYDKIMGQKMILRESRKGEKVTTLDAKTQTLPGGDIVIEDGSGKLIDLCGIMGGENSQVDNNSKNILLFVQNYNPINIRKTSMKLAKRSAAAVLFEKGLDSEQVKIGMLRGIDLFLKFTKGMAEKEILDLYPNPYQPKRIKVGISLICKRLGIEISKKEISEILSSLQFKPNWKGKELTCEIPSFRANDIEIPEDIVEEIARIHGYHSLPSTIMSGIIPDQLQDTPFSFEDKLKDVLKGYGGCEVYTLSLVSKDKTLENSLKLKNPLGPESEYLRTTLLHSLVDVAENNLREKESFHLFEVANVYLPIKNNLPQEKMVLSGIFANTDYREAKGIIESLLKEINIDVDYLPKDANDFLPSKRLVLKKGNLTFGQFGILAKNGLIYYELDVELLRKNSSSKKYQPIPKFPPQIEDITLSFPAKTKIGEVIQSISSIGSWISQVELKDVYKDNYTFRIWYQNPKKTLTDKEVEEIRNKILVAVKQKFGGTVKN